MYGSVHSAVRAFVDLSRTERAAQQKIAATVRDLPIHRMRRSLWAQTPNQDCNTRNYRCILLCTTTKVKPLLRRDLKLQEHLYGYRERLTPQREECPSAGGTSRHDPLARDGARSFRLTMSSALGDCMLEL